MDPAGLRHCGSQRSGHRGDLVVSFPALGGRAGTRLALAAAIVAGIMSIAQLAAAAIGNRDSGRFAALDQAAQWLTGLVKMLPWAELLIVAVLVLEALHGSRPWHTAVLGVALTGYVLAVHLTETRAGAGVLRAQLPLLCCRHRADRAVRRRSGAASLHGRYCRRRHPDRRPGRGGGRGRPGGPGLAEPRRPGARPLD